MCSSLLAFKVCFPLGSEALRQEDDGRTQEWRACLLGWFWGLSLASSLFFQFVASGPCLSPHCEPTACQERPPPLTGAAPAYLSILVNMYILLFEFSISEPGVILTLVFQGFSDGLSVLPLVMLLLWGPHT